MHPILSEGKNAWRVAGVDESAVLVDARGYYTAFYHAALRAKRSLVLAGWQFDTEVQLLRGADAEAAPLPVAFAAFLDALAKRTPELQIYVLAWDFSLVYALEREWLQDLRFALGTSDRVRFEFDRHPRFAASHHQKFAVVDGSIAFAGGLDLCDERWDDRRHAASNPLRVNVAGTPHRSNHEVQALVSGEAAAALAELFRERWFAATGERLELGRESHPKILPELRKKLAEDELLPLSARRVGLSRTYATEEDAPAQHEIRSLFETALLGAERSIYIETQYFTSRSMAAALVTRLRQADKPKLELAIVLPKGADNSKEAFALGDTQAEALGTIESAADEHGHELRFLCTGNDASGNAGTTFIHSKVLIVDDDFLSVGSANMTERSMGCDSELTLVWEAAGDETVRQEIRRVRASLLAEHAHATATELENGAPMIEVIDRWLSGQSALHRCHFQPVASNAMKNQIFDPGGPATLGEIVAEPPVKDDQERFSRGSSYARPTSSRPRSC